MVDTVSLPNAVTGFVGVGPGGNRALVHATAIAELPTTQLQSGDISWLMYVPAGAVIVDGFVSSDDMDTGTTLAYNIGDTTTTNLFFSATTTGQSAGSSQMLSAARYTLYATATRLKMTITTSAQTAVAGTFILGLSYFVDPSINVTTGITPVASS